MKIRASVRKTRDNCRLIRRRRRTLAVRPADPKHKRRQGQQRRFNGRKELIIAPDPFRQSLPHPHIERNVSKGENSIMRKIGGMRGSKRRGIPKGVTHTRASPNNTIATVADARGQVVPRFPAGACGSGGARKGTAFAAQTAAENAIRALIDQGVKRAEVVITGPGPGRDTALRAIRGGGVVLGPARDITPMPHNGCRPPKKRCVQTGKGGATQS